MLEVLEQFSMIFTGFLKLFLIIFVFCLSAFLIIPAVIRDQQARSKMICRNLTVLGYIVSGMILAASLLISVWPEFPPIFLVEYKIVDYVLLSVNILLITGNIMYFFKKEDNEEDNTKDKKAVTLYLSGKSSELISDLDDSNVDAMIQLFADKENAEMMIKQLEFLDQTVEINQKILEFYKNILGNADDTMMQ